MILSLPPLPDPPPPAKIAYMHWSSFYRAPLTLYIRKSFGGDQYLMMLR